MKRTFNDVEVKNSSRGIPCFDGSSKKVEYFIDENGKVWLNADDMGMGIIGKPNTCGNCIYWHGCKIKDRDICPGDMGGISEYDPTVTSEQIKEAILTSCRHSRDQLKELGLL